MNSFQVKGDFSLFGFTSRPKEFWQDRFQQRLGIQPRWIDLGSAGSFYFYTTYGDLFETETLLGLKLGFIRTPDVTPLSTRDLLNQKLITPHSVEPNKMRGNALLACLSQNEPEFSIYQTLIATPQLYYTHTEGEILCSSNQRALVALLDQPALNEAMVPAHFLFQLVPGPHTYYQDVSRLFPGQFLHWKEGRLQVDYAKDLRFEDEPIFHRVDPSTVQITYDRIKAVINTYLDDMDDQTGTTLLSGGVDSSVMQIVLNERFSSEGPVKTYSYDVNLPSFNFEVQYAQEASDLLETNHTIANIDPNTFPDILIRATEAVAQPVSGEADACKIAMAEYLASQTDTPRFYFVGQAADAIFGMNMARKTNLLGLAEKIPASPSALSLLAKITRPGSAGVAERLEDMSRFISALNQPDSYDHWPNTVCTYMNLDMAERLFGKSSIQEILHDRRQLEEVYFNSPDLGEQLHIIDLFTEGYEPAIFGSQMFLTHKKEQIYPYLDEDIVRSAFAFEAGVRFVKPGLGVLSHQNAKYILKQILIQKSKRYKAIAHKKKGGSIFADDLFKMMKEGVLHDLVYAIDRPSFLSQTEFETVLTQPNYFLWNLLTFDLFQKHLLKQN